MKINDAIYIAAVCIVALVFISLVWRPAGPAEGQAAPAGLGAAGTPRTVNTDLILRLIRERRLSDHLWLTAGAGISLGNRLELTHTGGLTTYKSGLDNGFFATVGLRLASW